MPDEQLMVFLCQETILEELGDEALLHSCPSFGEAVGEAINSGNLIPFTTELSGRLGEMDLYKACLLSNFIGFACEKEEDTSAGRGIIELFSKVCTQVYEMFQSAEARGECELPPEVPELYKENASQARAYCGFNILCVSTMAFLTRDAALRQLLAEMGLEEELAYLSEEVPESPYLKSVTYVNSMLKTCSDLKLLVLQPGKRQGFFAVANDLNNCFHLLFLLEEQIAENLGHSYGLESFPAAAPLIGLAHGEYPEEAWAESYSTAFMECNYSTADHAEFRNEDAMALIWGEMPPDCIPAVDGRAVIVLFEGGLRRGFDAPFLFVPHSALRPYVRIEGELTEQEYDAWLTKTEEAMKR